MINKLNEICRGTFISYLALAETIASGGSYLLIDPVKFDVVGLQVSGNHLSPVSEGMLYARAEIIHCGKKTHVWDVKIKSDTGKLISIARVTMMIIKKKQLPDAGSIEK
jgi:1,4-dihydroxy-2-naphthoyl-CoA hydrolase